MSDEPEVVEDDSEEVDFEIDLDAVPEMTGGRFPEELEEHLSDPVEEGEVPEVDGSEEDEVD
jgi:hypothetical protein